MVTSQSLKNPYKPLMLGIRSGHIEVIFYTCGIEVVQLVKDTFQKTRILQITSLKALDSEGSNKACFRLYE